ncbi:MAG: peptidoglycan DD-metalloendopeptidase family protein [Candidatus Paceibacterota bacterium]|jgi:LysM repeat protein
MIDYQTKKALISSQFSEMKSRGLLPRFIHIVSIWFANYRLRLLTALILLVIIFGARTVEAGLFSSVAKLLGLPVKVEGSKDLNSQNMPLLQPAVNSNPEPVKVDNLTAMVGGAAILPESGPNGTVADIKDRPNSDQVSVYVARKGDTMKAIAKMFEVEANTILWANDLASSYIPKEGDVLVILPVDGIIHTVLKGETLAGIAKKYGGDQADIIDYNDLDPTGELAVGDQIIIPGGEEKPTPGKVSKPKTKLAARYSGPDAGGYFLRPVSGGRKSQGIHGRNGIDIAITPGSALYAAAAGTVILAKDGGWNGGYGSYIIIQHPNGTQTLYGHLSRVGISRGAKVTRGQVIGATGNTGRSTGPHLHFEIHGATNPF